MEEGSEVRVCPYLGLASDASTWLGTATGSHRCHRWATPQRVEEERQTAYCLGDSHRRCPWYVSPRGDFSSRGPVQSPGMRQRLMGVAALLGVLLVSFVVIRMLIWPVVSDASLLNANGGTPTPTPAAVSAGSAGAGLPASVPAVSTPTAAATVDSGPTALPATGSTSPGRGPTSLPVAQQPTAAVGSSVAGSATPSPTRGSVATTATPARPTGTPATAMPTSTLPPGAQFHEVKAGDNLYDMAKTYGVTIEEIMAANGLTDRAMLKVGQKLVIPAKRGDG